MKLAEVVGLLDLKDTLKLKYTQMAIVFEDNLDDNITNNHGHVSHIQCRMYSTVPCWCAHLVYLLRHFGSLDFHIQRL